MEVRPSTARMRPHEQGGSGASQERLRLCLHRSVATVGEVGDHVRAVQKGERGQPHAQALRDVRQLLGIPDQQDAIVGGDGRRAGRQHELVSSIDRRHAPAVGAELRERDADGWRARQHAKLEDLPAVEPDGGADAQPSPLERLFDQLADEIGPNESVGAELLALDRGLTLSDDGDDRRVFRVETEAARLQRSAIVPGRHDERDAGLGIATQVREHEPGGAVADAAHDRKWPRPRPGRARGDAVQRRGRYVDDGQRRDARQPIDHGTRGSACPDEDDGVEHERPRARG